MPNSNSITHQLKQGISFKEIGENHVAVVINKKYSIQQFNLTFSNTVEMQLIEGFQEKFTIAKQQILEDDDINKALQENDNDLLDTIADFVFNAEKAFTEKAPIIITELNEIKFAVDYIMQYINKGYPINHYLSYCGGDLVLKIIKIGTPATIQTGDDKYPCVVTNVSPSGKTITVQTILYTRKPDYDFFNNQSHEYDLTKTQGTDIEVRKTKKGWQTIYKQPCIFGYALRYKFPGY